MLDYYLLPGTCFLFDVAYSAFFKKCGSSTAEITGKDIVEYRLSVALVSIVTTFETPP